MTTDRFVRWLPVLAAVAVPATAAPLAWSRDFGFFRVIFLIFFPAMLAVCAFLVVWAIVEKRWARRRSALATIAVIISFTPMTFLGARYLDHDRIAFLFWYPQHRQLVDEFAATDGIIMTWDSWGMAGMENDSYLVSNPSDMISNIDAAARWARRYSDCEIVDVQRMRLGLYILTTYNCPLTQ